MIQQKKIFKPRTLNEVLDFMEEKNRQGYECYFTNGRAVVEYFVIDNEKGKTLAVPNM